MTVEKCLITITPNGGIHKKPIHRRPKLDELKEIVGGFIEMIPHFYTYEGQPCRAFCNEEGKLSHFKLTPNPVATQKWEQSLKTSTYPDYLVGNIAIVVGPEPWLKGM